MRVIAFLAHQASLLKSEATLLVFWAFSPESLQLLRDRSVASSDLLVPRVLGPCPVHILTNIA